MNKDTPETATFIPAMNKRRKENIERIVAELNRRNFKQLDETNKEDLARVCEIVQDLFPDITARKCVEYAKVAIHIWTKERN